jgi:hypothetical protein
MKIKFDRKNKLKSEEIIRKKQLKKWSQTKKITTKKIEIKFKS